MWRLRRKLNGIVTKFLDLPQDVTDDLPRMTMIGNVQLYIENHRGIIHFSTETLKLALPKGRVEVIGKGLVIRAILPEEVFIEGQIENVQYIP